MSLLWQYITWRSYVHISGTNKQKTAGLQQLKISFVLALKPELEEFFIEGKDVVGLLPMSLI